MKKCPYCAEEIQDEAVVCRYCGREFAPSPMPSPASAPKPTPVRKRTSPVIVALIVILGILLIAYALSNAGRRPSAVSPTRRPTTESLVYAKDQVEVADFTCRHDSIGNMIIEGKVRNTSSLYVLQFVELRGTIYTKARAEVNNNTSYIDSDELKPGSTSTFTVYVDDPADEAERCFVAVEDAYFK